MPITATPINISHVHVPDDLSEILRKGGPESTPTFDQVLNRNRKAVAALRRQVWPDAIAAKPDAAPEAPEDVPAPHPGIEPEPTEVPAPEPTDPQRDPEG